jgi:4-hydroxy-3-polyprenylbenzoate decarboxylase
MDTLDYTGINLNQGSKLLWTVAGEEKRSLAVALPADFSLPPPFAAPVLFAHGILLCQGPPHLLPPDVQDGVLRGLAAHFAVRPAPGIALVVVVDDVAFAAANWDAFLWTAFTRSDPATDLYGPNEEIVCKHWRCNAPLIMDSRLKSRQAPPLEPDPAVEKRIDALAARGGPLEGLV